MNWENNFLFSPYLPLAESTKECFKEKKLNHSSTAQNINLYIDIMGNNP